jgi:hypothetical protein
MVPELHVVSAIHPLTEDPIPDGFSPRGAQMDGFSTRLMIAATLYGVACALPFGAGTVAVLATPSLAQIAAVMLPYIAAESLVIGAALAWHVAPSLQSKAEKRRR